ncbi:sulfotransferase family protein [Wenzhouxiangella sp. XN79A]|uniref:sulfotransferase family 2 domain-containing protein n=1 Tax=Wenzhouxiangella sp. XN79A TaxID=2724193 RepID=UPI00144ADDBB|nr:sulfotransferase family 2 domain-containing protein [Wenzhouxiangella sp. XN79A]NKI36431.1 sulfotransferase family protein [Wenzhouxiangella sp. XN79A]
MNIWGGWTYVTLLRDPVDRLVSNYKFVRTRKDYPDHERVYSGKYSFADFVDFTDETGRLNLQALWLSGLMPVETYSRKTFVADRSDEEVLAMALQNLDDHFALAAPVDRFDDFLLCCCKLFDWGIQYYANVNRGVGRDPQLAPEVLAAL